MSPGLGPPSLVAPAPSCTFSFSAHRLCFLSSHSVLAQCSGSFRHLWLTCKPGLSLICRLSLFWHSSPSLEKLSLIDSLSCGSLSSMTKLCLLCQRKGIRTYHMWNSQAPWINSHRARGGLVRGKGLVWATWTQSLGFIMLLWMPYFFFHFETCCLVFWSWKMELCCAF